RGHAVGDVAAVAHEVLENRRVAGGDDVLEHRGSERVDHAQDELLAPPPRAHDRVSAAGRGAPRTCPARGRGPEGRTTRAPPRRRTRGDAGGTRAPRPRA